MAGRQIQGQGGRRHRLLTPHDLAGIIARQGSGGGGSSGTNDYNDLINKPTLGTAAAKDIGFFALADSVLQSVVAGTNITVDNTDPQNPVINSSGGSGGGGSASDLAAAILADSPALFYKLDETSGTTLADSSGNGYDLTLKGTNNLAHTEVIPGAVVLNVPDSSSSANGASRSGPAGLTVPMNYSWTWVSIVSLWSLTNATAVSFCISGPSDSASDNFQIGIYMTGADGQFYLSTFWEQSSGANVQTDLGALPPAVPFMLAIKKDSSTKTLTYYINGKKINSVSYSLEPTGGTTVDTFINSIAASGTVCGMSGGYYALFTSLLGDDRIKSYAQLAGLY